MQWGFWVAWFDGKQADSTSCELMGVDGRIDHN